MNFERKFKKSLAEQWSMRFETLHPDGDVFDGIVTHITPEFIILREEVDFEFNGVVLIPRRLIKSVRDGKYDACCNQILRVNGTMKKLRVPRWLDACATISQVIDALKKRDIWFGVEILFNKGAKSAFYIGPATQVSDDDFAIKCYDATGEWEKEYTLDYDEIFKIEFDSKYCNHFNNFMRSKGGA